MSVLQIYRSDHGHIEVRLEQETVWLRQDQMSALFGRDRSVITKHVRNIFSENELDKESNVQIMHFAHSDKPVAVYSLDVIISVGYRVKSVEGIRFRQWANRILREHLTQGYTLHKDRFEKNAIELEKTLQILRKSAHQTTMTPEISKGLIDIAAHYAKSFLWLQRYDEGLLTEPPQTIGGHLFTAQEARSLLDQLKKTLIMRHEATHLFAKEREGGLAALIGNLNQTVFGEAAYPTIESKAAHLLYFVVKDHPFIDGNKRSAAFLFVEFLQRNHRLSNQQDDIIIDKVALTALTLLVAQSEPASKATMISLIINMLSVVPKEEV
jgi:prophage maintenance system killer protein